MAPSTLRAIYLPHFDCIVTVHPALMSMCSPCGSNMVNMLPNIIVQAFLALQTLLDQQTPLDCSSPMTSCHVTSQSCTLFLLQTNNNTTVYICPYILPKSIYTLSSYNREYIITKSLVVSLLGQSRMGCHSKLLFYSHMKQKRDLSRLKTLKRLGLDKLDLFLSKSILIFLKTVLGLIELDIAKLIASKLLGKQVDIQRTEAHL